MLTRTHRVKTMTCDRNRIAVMDRKSNSTSASPLLKPIAAENHPSVVKVSRPTTALTGGRGPTRRADKLDSVLRCTWDLTDPRPLAEHLPDLRRNEANMIHSMDWRVCYLQKLIWCLEQLNSQKKSALLYLIVSRKNRSVTRRGGNGLSDKNLKLPL